MTIESPERSRTWKTRTLKYDKSPERLAPVSRFIVASGMIIYLPAIFKIVLNGG